MLGSLRDGKFTSLPGVRGPVASPSTPVRVRLKLDVRDNGDHALACYIGDSQKPAAEHLFTAGATDPTGSPISFAGGVRFAVGVQNGFAAEFAGLDIRSVAP
jgi:hypothetical protein